MRRSQEMQSKTIFTDENELKKAAIKKKGLLMRIEREKRMLLEGEKKSKQQHVRLLKLKRKRDKVEGVLKRKTDIGINLSRKIEQLRNLEKDYLMRIKRAEKKMAYDDDFELF